MSIQFDSTNADCFVLTYKDGALSALAHDLKLQVTRFEVDIDVTARSIKAIFDARSIHVVGACKCGVSVPGVLSPRDIKEIEENIERYVIKSEVNPAIRFESSQVKEEGDGFGVVGVLFLHGRSKELRFSVCSEGARLIARVGLHQPDFGIRPFSTMFGTLKIKPDVVVQISLPAPQLCMR